MKRKVKFIDRNYSTYNDRAFWVTFYLPGLSCSGESHTPVC